jgi:predicted alpha/beta-hydrolase family hydrolase
MVSLQAETLSFAVDEKLSVSGLLQVPRGAGACLVLAHGAGAGMRHPFMTAIARELAQLCIATLRYQFPYMEQQRKRPDPPQLAHATVRAAIEEALRLVPGVPLFAGGKSFGGRMTSQAQALNPLPAVRGLVFLGFPLHPAGSPSDIRGKHLFEIQLPMLFLQGTRDALADMPLLEPLCERLGNRASLVPFASADHSFHVPSRSGQSDAEVLHQIASTIAAWISGISA